MSKIVIEKPADPLQSEIDRRRDAYMRKHLLASLDIVELEKLAVAAPVGERRSNLADGIRAAFAANGFGEKK